MKLRIATLMLLGICTVSAQNAISAEPNNIGELLKAKGIEWLLGNWETTTEKGEAVEAKFSLGMNDFIISVEASVGEKKNSGMIFYTQVKKSIIYTGADNLGGSMKGACQIEDGKFVMNLELTTVDGKLTKFTRYLSKIDADTMKSETFVFTDGKKPEQPTGVFEFKRKK
jgi:hypothetical protein